MRVQVEVWLHRDAHVTTCETPVLHLEQAQCTFWVPKAGCEWHVDTLRIKTPSLFSWMPSWIISLSVFPPFPLPARSTALWTWQQGKRFITSKTLALGLEAPRRVVRGCSRPLLNSSRTSAVPAVEANRLSYCAKREWIKKSAIWWWTLDASCKRVMSDPWQIFIIFGILYHVYRAYRDIYYNTVWGLY